MPVALAVNMLSFDWTFFCIFYLTKWQSILVCLVLSWKPRLVAICSVALICYHTSNWSAAIPFSKLWSFFQWWPKSSEFLFSVVTVYVVTKNFLQHGSSQKVEEKINHFLAKRQSQESDTCLLVSKNAHKPFAPTLYYALKLYFNLLNDCCLLFIRKKCTGRTQTQAHLVIRGKCLPLKLIECLCPLL